MIGITVGMNGEGRYVLSRDYPEAVAAAGGKPVLLPLEARDLGGMDGLLLSGGGDIAPDLYGEDPRAELRGVDRKRDEYELSLTREVLRSRIPVLAICRGIQVLAVAAQGRLIQDLSQMGDINHWQTAPRPQPHHWVEVLTGTRLRDILGVDRLFVNSFHHQAVAQVPPGFRIAARSSDGVIEAIESQGENFVLGVQWHPECMWRSDPLALRIFQAFVEACR
jgi:putative glutamine amidotransferase